MEQTPNHIMFYRHIYITIYWVVAVAASCVCVCVRVCARMYDDRSHDYLSATRTDSCLSEHLKSFSLASVSKKSKEFKCRFRMPRLK